MNPVDPSSEENLFVGVDIGTESVRAALFSASGQLLSVAKRPIKTWYVPGGVVEQSTDQIWPGVVEAVREILGQNPVGDLMLLFLILFWGNKMWAIHNS